MKVDRKVRDERVLARVNLKEIVSNVTKLTNHYHRNRKKDFFGAVPMVKCNAYGHGLVEVARKLEKSKLVHALGVASIEEAETLRKNKVKKPVWVFSGAAPLSTQLVSRARKQKFCLVVCSLEDLKFILRNDRKFKGFQFQVKFNTGMNRLGLETHEADEAVNILLKIRNSVFLGVATHFAFASNPSHEVTLKQVSEFKSIVQKFKALSPKYIHCANTAAVIEDERLKTSEFCNLLRPGIGIYGYPSDAENKVKLNPSLELSVKAIENRSVIVGAATGYDATYVAKENEFQTVLAVGYGDGFLRSLSNKNAKIVLEGNQKLNDTRILGRVSMDMSVIGEKVRPGDRVQFLGFNIEQGEAMALSAGTNIYEILTSISSLRVKRVYV